MNRLEFIVSIFAIAFLCTSAVMTKAANPYPNKIFGSSGGVYGRRYTEQSVINGDRATCQSAFAQSSNSTVSQPLRAPGLNLLQQAMDNARAPGVDPPQQAIDHARIMLEQNRHDLMSKPGVLGVGLGRLEDNSQPAVIVYVDRTRSAKPQLPDRLDDVPVRVIFTDPFRAY